MRNYAGINSSIIDICKKSGILSKALTARKSVDYTIRQKRLRYFNRGVCNSNKIDNMAVI